MAYPAHALIRFFVDDDDFVKDDFLGTYVCPLQGIRPGFRHIQLENKDGTPIPGMTLFVKITFQEHVGENGKKDKLEVVSCA